MNFTLSNCAYLTSASAYLEDEEGNLILDSDGNRILDNDFWDLTDLAVKQPDGSITIDGDLSNVNISIRNNNVFTDATLAGYYEEWASKESGPNEPLSLFDIPAKPDDRVSSVI